MGIILITGGRDSGKTTWCTGYSHWLAGQRLTIGGILCPEARDTNRKIGQNITDIQKNQTVLFGRLAKQADFPGELVGEYRLSYEGLEFAKRAIQEALENRCDVVFIDEFGRLELSGKGIVESVNKAYQEAPNTTTIVRRSLINKFLNYSHMANPRVVFRIKDIECDANYPPLGKE